MGIGESDFATRTTIKRVSIIQLCIAMKDILSKVLSLASVALIPFIPDNTTRYAALVLVLLSATSYLVSHNSPASQVARLDASIEEIVALLNVAAHECAGDPRFTFEAGLKLEEWVLSSRLVSPLIFHRAESSTRYRACASESSTLNI
jgi:hypothetical protein